MLNQDEIYQVERIMEALTELNQRHGVGIDGGILRLTRPNGSTAGSIIYDRDGRALLWAV